MSVDSLLAAWSSKQFENLECGDKRLDAVGRALVRRLAAGRSRGTVWSLFEHASEARAVYRFLDNEKTSFETMLAPHRARTRAACAASDHEVLLIEDTTTLDYSKHTATEGLGPVGNGKQRGCLLHTTLAVECSGMLADGTVRAEPLGIFGAHLWTRPEAGLQRKTPPGRRGKKRTNKPSKAELATEPSESERWARTFAGDGAAPNGRTWTYVADRESDCYEVFDRCASSGVGYVIRAAQARALADDDQSVFEAVASAQALGSYELELRARPGAVRRTASVEVRAVEATLKPPSRLGRRGHPVTLRVVEAREVNAPADVTPVHWVLLTSLAADGFNAALRVVRTYETRWLVEEYHKALKSGLGVEQMQLRTFWRMEPLIAAMMVLAAGLVRMKCLAATRGDEPLDARDTQHASVVILEKRHGRPPGGWTVGNLWIWIARVGGYKGRKSDGPPGWATIWEGWDRLMTLTEGYDLARGSKNEP